MSIFGPCIKGRAPRAKQGKPEEPHKEFGMTTVKWEAPHGAERKSMPELPLIYLRPTPTTTICSGGKADIRRINNDFGQFYLSWHSVTEVRLVQISSHSVGLFGGILSAGQEVKVTRGVVLLTCILEPGDCTPIRHVALYARSRAQVTIHIEVKRHLHIRLTGRDVAEVSLHGEATVTAQELDLKILDLTNTTLLSLVHY